MCGALLDLTRSRDPVATFSACCPLPQFWVATTSTDVPSVGTSPPPRSMSSRLEPFEGGRHFLTRSITWRRSIKDGRRISIDHGSNANITLLMDNGLRRFTIPHAFQSDAFQSDAFQSLLAAPQVPRAPVIPASTQESDTKVGPTFQSTHPGHANRFPTEPHSPTLQMERTADTDFVLATQKSKLSQTQNRETAERNVIIEQNDREGRMRKDITPLHAARRLHYTATGSERAKRTYLCRMLHTCLAFECKLGTTSTRRPWG